jgi:NADP-dependent 3-hydroxy acid dehydrogenase YdfG
MTKTSLITRASGIGAETARQLAQAGHGPDSVQLFIAPREEDASRTITGQTMVVDAGWSVA